MTDFHFRAELARLAFVWPRAFPTPRAEAIWNHCKKLTNDQFTRLCDRFINEFRQQPYPRDFQEAARNISPLDRRTIQDQGPIDIKCRKCFDSGWFEVELRESPSLYIIRCDCNAGAASFYTQLPIWSENLHGKHFITHFAADGRWKVWSPGKDKASGFISTLNELTSIWKLKKNESISFWDEWNYEPI